MKIYSTISNSKEDFVPYDKHNVGMYVCGPTVYDNIHIGNARSFVIFDVLYRLLCKLYKKDCVKYVRNITDVDDKITRRAEELGVSIYDLTNQTIRSFHSDISYLNCLTPTCEPKATDHIRLMIDMINRLIDKGHAYVTNGSVYFEVFTYKNYKKLFNKSLDNTISGVRIDIDKDKRNPGDFALWKACTNSKEESFDSPWGNGRPGWHIECSAMSTHYLGNDFDIHGGGRDLTFPHHTNEIAQSVCANPESSYAKYWVHNGFLLVNGNKMSKSLNNFITIKDLIKENIHGETIRYVLVNTHYRKPLDFNKKMLHDAKENLNYLYRTIKDVESNEINVPQEFISILFNDINTHGALQYLLSLANQANKSSDNTLKQQVKSCANFLGLLKDHNWFHHNISKISKDKIEKLIQQRFEAKKNKNWKLADEIRNELAQCGIKLEDNKDGTTSWIESD